MPDCREQCRLPAGKTLGRNAENVGGRIERRLKGGLQGRLHVRLRGELNGDCMEDQGELQEDFITNILLTPEWALQG